jgi:hypothetical protein
MPTSVSQRLARILGQVESWTDFPDLRDGLTLLFTPDKVTWG